MEGVFCKKKWALPQRRVHYVQYQYFLFYLFGGCVCTTLIRTPAYGPAKVMLITSYSATACECCEEAGRRRDYRGWVVVRTL